MFLLQEKLAKNQIDTWYQIDTWVPLHGWECVVKRTIFLPQMHLSSQPIIIFYQGSKSVTVWKEKEKRMISRPLLLSVPVTHTYLCPPNQSLVMVICAQRRKGKTISVHKTRSTNMHFLKALNLHSDSQNSNPDQCGTWSWKDSMWRCKLPYWKITVSDLFDIVAKWNEQWLF